MTASTNCRERTTLNARPRVAFLTGQSDPGRGALSPVQRTALDALAERSDDIHFDPHQFPWDSAAGAWRPIPLLRASLANGRQYLGARRGILHGVTPAQCDAARCGCCPHRARCCWSAAAAWRCSIR
jgi:hypothetical protein